MLQGVWQPRSSNVALDGWMVAPNVTLTSPFPVNVVQGPDLNGDGVNNDRPLFRGRNDSSGYGFREVNLRVSRSFRYRELYSLELIGEAENLLNSLNAACTTAGCTGAVVNTFNARTSSALPAPPIRARSKSGGESAFESCVTLSAHRLVVRPATHAGGAGIRGRA